LRLASEYEHVKNYARAIEYYQIYLKTFKEDERVPIQYSARVYYEKQIEKLRKLLTVAIK